MSGGKIFALCLLGAICIVAISAAVSFIQPLGALSEPNSALEEAPITTDIQGISTSTGVSADTNSLVCPIEEVQFCSVFTERVEANPDLKAALSFPFWEDRIFFVTPQPGESNEVGLHDPFVFIYVGVDHTDEEIIEIFRTMRGEQ